MKTKTIILTCLLTFMALLCPVRAQLYDHYTNLHTTNFLVALTTNTYTGTNYLLMTRNSEFAWTVAATGLGADTNALLFTYQYGRTPSNWLTSPLLTLRANLDGTNAILFGTNDTVGTFGYLRPYQQINLATNDATNVSVDAVLKSYRRDHHGGR